MTVAAEGALRTSGVSVPIVAVDVSAYTVPTDEPESDGTAEWELDDDRRRQCPWRR